MRQIGFAVRRVEVWSSRTDGVREMLRAESSAYEPGRMTPSVSLPLQQAAD